jgi:hypothetical protein
MLVYRHTFPLMTPSLNMGLLSVSHRLNRIV